jgi:hypothetical protein
MLGKFALANENGVDITAFEKLRLNDSYKEIQGRYSLACEADNRKATRIEEATRECRFSKPSLRKIQMRVSDIFLTFRENKLEKIAIVINHQYPQDGFMERYRMNESGTESMIAWLTQTYGNPDSHTQRPWASKGHVDVRWAPREHTLRWNRKDARLTARYHGPLQNQGIIVTIEQVKE